MTTLGDRIRKKRKQIGMTLETLALKVGTSKQTIQRYETGIIQNIPSDKIEIIAKALSVSPAYLMGWDIPFSIRLKNALEQRNKKPVDLAKGTGLSQSIISQYLSGGFMPKYDNLRRIADYLNVSVDYLNGSSNDINDTSSQLSNDDQDILNLFHMLSDENKSFVISMMKKLINN